MENFQTELPGNGMSGLTAAELCNAKESLGMGNVFYCQWEPKKQENNLIIIN